MRIEAIAMGEWIKKHYIAILAGLVGLHLAWMGWLSKEVWQTRVTQARILGKLEAFDIAARPPSLEIGEPAVTMPEHEALLPPPLVLLPPEAPDNCKKCHPAADALPPPPELPPLSELPRRGKVPRPS